MAEIPTSAITLRDGLDPRTNMDPEALAARGVLLTVADHSVTPRDKGMRI